MTPKRVSIHPGETSLADWRAIYRGAAMELAPGHEARVAASAELVARLGKGDAAVYGINTGFGALANKRIAPAEIETLQRNLVLSHCAGVGAPAPRHVVRLMFALKIASLAQGASGVRPQTLGLLEALLEQNLLPAIPSQGSVGASGDLAPLAHMSAALIGEGELYSADGTALAAKDALAKAGLEPVVLAAKEGLALLNGTQFSTAFALAGLFEAERLFQTALVSGALSTDAARGSDTPFDARLHEIRRHKAQCEVAAALMKLLENSGIRESHREGDTRVQDPYCLRCQPQVMGAVLQVLRQAAHTLEVEASGVSDNPLVFAEDGVVLSGGNFHAEPVAFAADMIALAVAEIGSCAERRIAMLVDSTLSGLPAFLTPNPGLNSGFMIAQVTAAALASENKQRAAPASVDSIPTCANQEDHVSMAAHAACRLLPMVENGCGIIGIELLAAAQGCDFHMPLRSSASMEAVRMLIRGDVPRLEDDRLFAPDIECAQAWVRSGAAVDVVGALPGVEGA